jgi:N utilization substance protein B
MASRHLSRSIALQSLFEWDFYGRPEGKIEEVVERNLKEFGPGLENHDFVWQLVRGVIEHLSHLDKIIVHSAPEWPLEQTMVVDRNVLRIGLYELLYAKREEVPPKVAINEAIELAKTFGGESSGKFVNGVLGTVYAQLESLEDISGQETLCGAVVYREKEGRYQIALLLDAFDRWTLPKGHAKAGETPEQTALREVKEELGLPELELKTRLGEREYAVHEPDKDSVKKKVIDFLIEAKGNTDPEPETSSGIKDAKWFELDQLDSLDQYASLKPLLGAVVEVLKQKNEQ